MHGPMILTDRTAVVTGAASGIGRGIALALARRGCQLALVDIDDQGLRQTAEQLGRYGIPISCYTLDIADAEAVAALPDHVFARHTGVDLLVNNAGVAIMGSFEQISAEEFDWLFEINFHGLVRMTRAFLPLLKASPDARIVNLSSVFGLIAPPGQTAYSASKFAVRGFSEALRYELQHSTVGVTVVHPGGIATDITAKARKSTGISETEVAAQIVRSQKLLSFPPEQAGELIVKGIQQRRDRVLVGSYARSIAMLVRLFPGSYWRLMSRIYRS